MGDEVKRGEEDNQVVERLAPPRNAAGLLHTVAEALVVQVGGRVCAVSEVEHSDRADDAIDECNGADRNNEDKERPPLLAKRVEDARDRVVEDTRIERRRNNHRSAFYPKPVSGLRCNKGSVRRVRGL
eukprot:Amastigsp_a676326_92.p4 type:complete len:128 gc:universal Amastigsp_a676326_92:1333-1716(+)